MTAAALHKTDETIGNVFPGREFPRANGARQRCHLILSITTLFDKEKHS
jgi:hypothetical protein